MNRRQTRAIFPTTLASYEAFVKQAKMEPVVEDIGEGGSLQWVGPRQTDRVLLYFHGTFGEASSFHEPFSSRLEGVGHLIFGGVPSAPDFWNFIQKNLESRGKPTDIVMLNYSEYQICFSFLPTTHDSSTRPG